MKPMYRGIFVAFLQCLIVLTVAGKYSLDRERLPRVWAKAAPFDPNLPIRGRYVSLRLQVDGPSSAGEVTTARLSAVGGRLVAEPDPAGTARILMQGFRGNFAQPGYAPWVLMEPVAFFIPESVPDPSGLKPGEELWVEVTVPAKGPPRPIRLGVKKDGVLKPLDL
ncbi:MAG TPA: hypothetical protein VKR61_14665 [Bryobacteraceae bacterium]|nr:hypothetical protein [Bryobacteraceae bacterium]